MAVMAHGILMELLIFSIKVVSASIMNARNVCFQSFHENKYDPDGWVGVEGKNIVCRLDQRYVIPIFSCMTGRQALNQAKKLALQLIDNQEAVSADYVAEQFLRIVGRIFPYQKNLDKEYRKMHSVDFAIGEVASAFTEPVYRDGEIRFDLVSEKNRPVMSFCCPASEPDQRRGIVVRRAHFLYFPVYEVSTVINRVTIKKTPRYLILEAPQLMVWQVDKEVEEGESPSDYANWLQSTRLLIRSTLNQKATAAFARQLGSINRYANVRFEAEQIA